MTAPATAGAVDPPPLEDDVEQQERRGLRPVSDVLATGLGGSSLRRDGSSGITGVQPISGGAHDVPDNGEYCECGHPVPTESGDGIYRCDKCGKSTEEAA